MKKIILLIALLHNLIALDSISTTPEDQKAIVSKIVEVLGLESNKDTRKIVYEKLDDFFTNNWSAHWTTNAISSKSEVNKNNAQLCDVSIYSDNRVVNCTFIYFKEEKQLFVTIKQYVEAESKIVLELYRKRKDNPDYLLENETDSYATFKEKDYISYVTHHVRAPAGMLIYESSYVFDIE